MEEKRQQMDLCFNLWIGLIQDEENILKELKETEQKGGLRRTLS